MVPPIPPLLNVPVVPHNHTQNPPWDDILAAAELPLPGPDHYAARRKLWLTPRHIVKSPPPDTSTSRQRLEELLTLPGAAYSDEVWDSGIGKVWKRLNSGGNLKQRLPMAIMIKIVHAAWLRDDTWPAKALAPESDDILPDDENSVDLPLIYPLLSTPATEHPF